jgi:hypothetical protein
LRLVEFDERAPRETAGLFFWQLVLTTFQEKSNFVRAAEKTTVK